MLNGIKRNYDLLNRFYFPFLLSVTRRLLKSDADGVLVYAENLFRFAGIKSSQSHFLQSKFNTTFPFFCKTSMTKESKLLPAQWREQSLICPMGSLTNFSSFSAFYETTWNSKSFHVCLWWAKKPQRKAYFFTDTKYNEILEFLSIFSFVLCPISYYGSFYFHNHLLNGFIHDYNFA